MQLASARAHAALSGGPEFQVNTYTPSGQDEVDTCAFDDGSFVVAWESSASLDGDLIGVFGQRYTAEGAPLGGEFQVNTYTTVNQRGPAICCSASGFVVSWASYEQDGDGAGIFGQRFSASGGPIGGEFQVNTYTPNLQVVPDICCQTDGSFVVVWQSYPEDGSNDGVFGQAFASGGAPSGGQFQVNTYTSDAQEFPALCCDGAGGFVVAWESTEQDGQFDGIFAQAYSGPGVPDGAEFQVNTATLGDQGEPAICCGDFGFAVAWMTPDGDSDGVATQAFSGPASPIGGEFLANTFTQDGQASPALCCHPDGFTVVWEDNPVTPTRPLLGRTFDASGQPNLLPFVVTAYPNSDADDPAIACATEDGLLVVWETDSSDSPPRDGSTEGVFARLFRELTIQEIPTLGSWGLGLLALVLAAGGAFYLRRQ